MTTETARPELRRGVLFSLGAYTIWGLFPLYLRLVRTVAPLEFIIYRMLLSLGFVFAVLALRRQWGWLGAALRSPPILGASLASGIVLTANWFTFVWAVARHRIVDASLGYFITPLVSIALGALVLGERLSRIRTVAVGLAFLGVLWLAIEVGQVPWIGIVLAATFGTYGLLRKVAALGALEGLALETLLLGPLALVVLLALARGAGGNHFASAGAGERLLILAAGPVTAVPLLLFAAGARRLPLWLVGILQYVGPTLQLLVGVVVGHEPFRLPKLLGYALIWAAFILASLDASRADRRPDTTVRVLSTSGTRA
jgi:chloramphenicol-sensitive protein RarD